MQSRRSPKRQLAALFAALALALLVPALSARGAEVGADDVRVSDMAGLGATTGAALNASVAYNSSEQQHLVVWSGTEALPAGEQNRIYGQLVGARTGVETGTNDYLVAEIPLSPDPDLDALDPVVVYNNIANEYFVAFIGNSNPATTETEVYGQRLNADGSRNGTVFQISRCGSPGDVNADVGAAIDSALDVAYNATANQYLVVFRCDDVGDNGAINSEFEIYGRLVEADGIVVGANDFQISQTEGANGNAAFNAEAPSVAWNSDLNEYLVVFGADNTTTGDGSREIYGQRLSAAGAEVGTNDFAISSTPVATRDSSTADVAYNPASDEYLVVWGGDRVIDNIVQVHGQRLSATGAALGTDDFQIGANKADPTNPQVAIVYNSIDDEFLVSWNRGGGATTAEVTVQRIDANGVALGTDDQVVSEMAFSLQGPSALAYSPLTNTYLAAWAGSDDQGGQISGENEVFVQFLAEPVDMATTKGVSPARPAPGDAVTYTISYANNGPNRILDVVLTDLAPAELTGVICTVNPGFTGSAPLLRAATACVFDIEELLSGQGGTITIAGTVAGTIAADGSVSGSPADGTVVNNTVGITSTTPHLDSNGANSSAGAAFTVDYPPRVVSITRVGPSPTNGASVQWLVTFSEPVTGGAAGNFALTTTGTLAGASVSTVSGSGATRTVTVNTGTGDGTLRLDLNSGAGIADVSDGKALVGLPATGQVYTLDKTPPTVTVEQGAMQADPTNAGPIAFRVEFSEPIDPTSFTPADVSLTGTAGATTAAISGGPSVFTVSVSGMAGDGTVTASLPAGVVSDPAGNTNVASTSIDNTVTYDVTAPSVTINQGASQPDPANAGPIVFDVSFSEPVTGFTGADVVLSGSAGATTALVSGSGASYTVSVSGMTSDGTVTAAIAAGAATDAAGNLSAASTSTDNSVAYDATAPSVTVEQATGQLDPTNADPITFRVVFSEPIDVASFTSADVTLGGSAGATTAVASEVAPNDGTTFEISVSGMAADGTVTAAIAAGAATDAAGNANTASTSTDNSVVYDATAPSVTVEQATGQLDPTNASQLVFEVVFSKPIDAASFSGADVTLSGTAGATTAVVTEVAPNDGTTFTVAVSGMAADGTVTASLAAGVVSDPAGNPNTASTSTDNTVTVDTTAPSVTINQAVSQADPANAGPISFEVVFSEPVTGFSGAGVTLGGTAGATTAVVTEVAPNDGTTFTVAVSGMTSDGTVTAAITAGAATDAAGNPNAASSSTDNSVTFDASGPLATVEQAKSQADPASAGPIVFEVVFSEPINVASFTATDVTLGGTAGATTAVVTEVAPNDGTTFTVAVSGMTGDGTVTASLAAGVVSDSSGNGILASTSADNSVTYDAAAPSVTIEQGAGQADPTNAGPLVFDVVFSEPVTGFDSADVALGGAAGATTAVVTEVAPNDGTTFTVAVSGMTGDGTVTAIIAAGAATDAAGNPNGASTSADNSVSYDTTGPSVTVGQAPAQADPALAAPIGFVVVFGEPVTGFDDTDVALGGTAGATMAVVTEVAPNDGTTFEVAVSGMTSAGTVTASVAAGAASDLAGNASAASTSTDNTVTFDPAAPVVTGIARADADPSNGATLGFVVTFSAAVTGVDQSDFTLTTSGGISGASVTAVSGSGNTRTVTVSSGAGSGTLRLDLTDDDSIVDSLSVALGGAGAGNGDFSGGQLYTIDRLAPQAGQLSVPAVVAGGADLTVTVVFSDNLGVSAASLATGAIQVSGPGGFSQAAELVSVSPSGDGSPRTATYRLTAPGGAWDSADNGDYSVGLAAGQVRDMVGNRAAAAALGSFNVDLSGPPALFRVYLPQAFQFGPLPWEFPYSRRR